MTVARERGQWFWIGRGEKAVALAQACAIRAYKEGRPDIAARWERTERLCNADPERPLKIPLPKEYVERGANLPDARPWWKE